MKLTVSLANFALWAKFINIICAAAGGGMEIKMLFFYVRHGDPIYRPDSLTPKGEREAEAIGKRLAMYGVDEIYTSTSNRAILTSQPTRELLGKTHTELEFCHESLAHKEFSGTSNGVHRWICELEEFKNLFVSPEMRRLDKEWYTHPALAETGVKDGWKRISDATDEFLASLGYEHIREENRYRVLEGADENKRVALFAHEGFGLIFLSALLDIPYPMISTHFHIRTTGLTVIEFKHEDGFSIPKVFTHSNDAHLYKEGLPLGRKYYKGEIIF